MRVEAESISSHGAAIVAFEARGLRTLSSRFERKRSLFNGRFSKNCERVHGNKHTSKSNREGPPGWAEHPLRTSGFEIKLNGE